MSGNKQVAEQRFFCSGRYCPGYSWRASERPHPYSCVDGFDEPRTPEARNMRDADAPQLQLFDPDRHYHKGDDVTAREAAFFQRSRAGGACSRILAELRQVWPAGLTDDEGAERLAMFSYPKRRCDLFQAGLVEPMEETRPSGRGRPMRVWRAVQ